MEEFKKKEEDFPTYLVANNNFITTPLPKVGLYLKACITPQHKDGNVKFEWQKKLQPGWIADIAFLEKTFDTENDFEAEFWASLPQKLLEAQLLVTIRDWRPGNTEFASETRYGTTKKRIPGYFIGSIVEAPKFTF